jgi:hypothetical protein
MYYVTLGYYTLRYTNSTRYAGVGHSGLLWVLWGTRKAYLALSGTRTSKSEILQSRAAHSRSIVTDSSLVNSPDGFDSLYTVGRDNCVTFAKA